MVPQGWRAGNRTTMPHTGAVNMSDPMAPSTARGRGTWQGMIDQCEALLIRSTGEGSDVWAQRARAAGLTEEAPLKAWLIDHGVRGYASNAVEWKVLGYPDSFLKSADELLDAQYADRPQLRPIGDALLAWAESVGAEIQMRKTYVALRGRRKFAQIAPATKAAVDVHLRLAEAAGPPAATARVAADDPLDQRIRLRSLEDVTNEVLDLLARSFAENR